jgi:hypothetical protein
MPNQEEILHQQDLLSVHRRSLAQLLKQQAMVGMASADQATGHNIRDARENIQRIKEVLREWAVEVEDLPDDSPPGKPQPEALPSIPAPQAQRSTIAGPVPSQAVGEGLIALSELMRAPEVRETVADIRAQIYITRKQIDNLTKYKSVHDLFQVVEICYTPISPVIYRNGQLLPSDQISWEVLEYQVLELKRSIDYLLDYGRLTFFPAEAAAWAPKLERARSELEQGVTKSEPEQIKNATNRIKVVLYRELSRVNNSLVAAAKGAQLDVLVQAMRDVRDKLAEFQLDEPATRRFRTFERGMNTLDRMSDQLTELTTDHDSWQAIDDDLRRVEAAGMSELEDAWQDVRRMMESLCATSTEEWATRLQEIARDLETAFAGQNPVRVWRAFRDFRSRASFRFNQVDQTLLKLCDDLQKVGEEPLTAVLRMLE